MPRQLLPNPALLLQDVTKAPLDMSLFLKLQKRVTELEQEKQSLQNELDRKDEQFQRARARVRRAASLARCPAFTFSLRTASCSTGSLGRNGVGRLI